MLKGLCVRGSWRPNTTATYWPPLLWPSALCLSHSPGLLNRKPRGPALRWMLAFSTTLVTNGSGFQTNWISFLTELYNSSIAHSISLEWHVWSSSNENNCHAVHRSLSSGASVYDCTMGFYLGSYCQPSPHTRFLPITAIGMCHFRRLWNGKFGRVEGQYTTQSLVWVQLSKRKTKHPCKSKDKQIISITEKFEIKLWRISGTLAENSQVVWTP